MIFKKWIGIEFINIFVKDGILILIKDKFLQMIRRILQINEERIDFLVDGIQKFSLYREKNKIFYF